MLRSLVCSEMCIRDRLDPQPGQAVSGLQREHHAGEEGGGARHPERAEACLLYTSDAADDPLCVDLGGRRIIKKKQEQYDQFRHAKRTD